MSEQTAYTDAEQDARLRAYRAMGKPLGYSETLSGLVGSVMNPVVGLANQAVALTPVAVTTTGSAAPAKAQQQQAVVDASVSNATTPAQQAATTQATTTQTATTTAPPPVVTQPAPVQLSPVVAQVVSTQDGYVEPLAYYNSRTAYGNGATPTFRSSGLPMNFSTNKFHNNGSDPQLSSWSGLNKSYSQLDPIARMYADEYLRKARTSNTQMLGATINNDLAQALSSPQVAQQVQQGLLQGQGLQEALSGAMANYNLQNGQYGAFNMGLQHYVPAAGQRLSNLVSYAVNSGNDMPTFAQGQFGVTAPVAYQTIGDNVEITMSSGQKLTLPKEYAQSAINTINSRGAVVPQAQQAKSSSSALTMEQRQQLKEQDLRNRLAVLEQQSKNANLSEAQKQQNRIEMAQIRNELGIDREVQREERKSQAGAMVDTGS